MVWNQARGDSLNGRIRQHGVTRREAIAGMGAGFGSVALCDMLLRDSEALAEPSGAVGVLHLSLIHI